MSRRITWPGDMLRFAAGGFGLRVPRPDTAPEPDALPPRLSLQELTRTPALIDLFAQRLDYRIAGVSSLEGLDAPVIFASNEQGVLDWPVLRRILPPRLRTSRRGHRRALHGGRSVVIFAEGPDTVRFGHRPAELANQFNVPIIPVAILGTFNLKAILRLSLRAKPRVAVRFGAPIYVRGRAIAEVTEELQLAVGELFARGEISWWAGQKPLASLDFNQDRAPRWRRLWDQTAPQPVPRSVVWRRTN